MSDANLLRLVEVSFVYRAGGRPVIDGLSLELRSGIVTAILGPNGAGKTTLLLMLLGLLQPTSGSILLMGNELKRYTHAERSRLIALVPQSEHIPFAHTAEEYVLLGRTPHLRFLEMPTENDLCAVDRLFEALSMSHLQQRAVQELSGGEQQMVILARALAQEPRLLLLDEPFAHLDLLNRDRIMSVIRRLSSRGVSVLFTTHDPDAAVSLADHVVLMREGRALAVGPLGQALTSEHLCETYGLPLRVVQIDGRPIVLHEARS